MTDTLYDNPEHWKSIHLRYPGSLKAVGRSGLSETYNRYKYRSEEATFTNAVERVVLDGWNEQKTLNVFEIGAGTGYWLRVVRAVASRHQVPVSFTALDLSEQALGNLAENLPGTKCIVENAGLADPNARKEQFDLVMSSYCLHHITATGQFSNALQMAVNSVKPGGFLLLMDCFIDRPYSPYYTVDPGSYTGSGLPRRLALVDQTCETSHMRRIFMADPVSFLMNNVLEDDSATAFRIKSMAWKVLHRLYQNEAISRVLMPLIFPLDRFLKNRGNGYSTRLLIYRKQQA